MQLDGDRIFSRSGTYVGRLSGNRLFGPDGRYVATLDGNRLVFRSTESAHMGGAHARYANRAGSAAANSARSAMWGAEPDIPD